MRVKTDLRYELKYLINREQHDRLLDVLSAHMDPDGHGGSQGTYTITSLYYDTDDYRAYWDKLEGHKVRRKVRVRSYGHTAVTPQSLCFLEVKQRVDRRMGKRRVKLPYASATAFGEFVELGKNVDETDREVLQEVYYLYRMLQLRPACVVGYQRLALNGREAYPDLRVTFDTRLQGRIHDLSLASTGHTQNQTILAPDWTILEVKVNRSVPYWLSQILAEHGCTFRRVSKYCLALDKSSVIRGRQRVVGLNL